jgi:hypothetical protein
MQEILFKHIERGDFYHSRELLRTIKKEKQYDFFTDISFEGEASASLYTFICFLLLEGESDNLHCFAGMTMSTGLTWLEGAYSSGVCHMRRAIKLNNASIDLKQFLLWFYGVPDCVLSKEDAKQTIYDILRISPGDSCALDALKNFDLSSELELVSTSKDKIFMFYIIQGKYEDAKNVVKGMAFDEFVLFFRPLCAEYKTLALYTFIIFKLLDNEIQKWHNLACEVLRNELSSLSGAESSALFHEQRIT